MALEAGTDIRFVLSRIRAGSTWGWKGGSIDDLNQLDWRDGVQVEPTEQEIADDWILVLAEKETGDTSKDGLTGDVDALTGLAVSALSDAQKTTLLEGVLSQVAGLDGERKIRPAADWIQ